MGRRLANFRHERYCQEYCIDHNSKDAYARAGFVAGNGNAHRLHAKIDIQLRIAVLEQEGWERLSCSVEVVREEMHMLAFINPQDLYVPGTNKLRPLCDMPDDIVRAIKEVETNELGEIVKIKLESKKGALDSLMRHLNMFEKDQHAGSGTINVHLDAKDEKA